MNQFNYKGVCRTVPATPGLLNILSKMYQCTFKNEHLSIQQMTNKLSCNVSFFTLLLQRAGQGFILIILPIIVNYLKERLHSPYPILSTAHYIF